MINILIWIAGLIGAVILLLFVVLPLGGLLWNFISGKKSPRR